MGPENALSIKLAWLEVNAAGTFTIATLAVVVVIYFAMSVWLRRG